MKDILITYWIELKWIDWVYACTCLITKLYTVLEWLSLVDRADEEWPGDGFDESGPPEEDEVR